MEVHTMVKNHNSNHMLCKIIVKRKIKNIMTTKKWHITI